MNRIERVVVDECVGQESPLVGQLRQRLGEQPVKFVFLATEHPGIPDIEILDKLLDVRSALLTQDRVLHNLAIGRGFRSFVHTPESGLTDRRLAHVSVRDKQLPVASGDLRDSYQHRSSPEAKAITKCLYGFLSAHQLKHFRTKRRRIRAHFGSPDNILTPALTIGQPRTAQAMVGGSMLKLDARHGVKSLFPASESYFLDRGGNEPLQATCWALVHLFQLQLSPKLTQNATLRVVEEGGLNVYKIMPKRRWEVVACASKRVLSMSSWRGKADIDSSHCRNRFCGRVDDPRDRNARAASRERCPYRR